MQKHNINIILITGLSGSGKTTITKALAEKYNSHHYEMSDYAKQSYNEDNFSGNLINYVDYLFKNCQEAKFIKKAIEEIKQDKSCHTFISGIRFISEYKELVNSFKKVFFIYLEAEELIRYERKCDDLVNVGLLGKQRDMVEKSWGFEELKQYADFTLDTSNLTVKKSVLFIENILLENLGIEPL